MAQYPTQQQQQQQTWKYTQPAVPATTQSSSTKDWQQFVNNQGITNWEEHLRSQGIDPQANQKLGLNPDGTTKEQWYNPYLECQPKFGNANGDIAPLVGTKTKYLATPGWPTRTMGVFECKWEIKREPSVKFIKLTFMTMDFDCNGLNPTTKSWGTANHVKIWDGNKVKTIDCGKPRNPPFYSTSDSIFVQLQINAAGYGVENGYKGGKMRILYQSVRQKGTPILKQKAKPTPSIQTILPRHQGRILNPQDPAILNNPNHIQHPKNRGGLINPQHNNHLAQRNHQQQHQQHGQQRPQMTYHQPQVPQQILQQVVPQQSQPINLPPNTIILNEHGQVVQLKQATGGSELFALGNNGAMMGLESTTELPIESTTTTNTSAPAKSSTKSVSIAFGMIFMILLLILIWFAYKKIRAKMAQRPKVQKAPPQGANAVDVVTFVNDLVAGRKEASSSGTGKTVITNTDSSGDKPRRPDLPYSKIKISSLEPRRAEVSKWDD